mgnify:CR=1 FL=1
MSLVYIGIGSNRTGNWGLPLGTITYGISALRKIGLRICLVSPIYATAPVGPPCQDNYLNAVVAVRTALAPEVLLARLKVLERRAGRVAGPRWGARTVDFDIIDYNGRRQGSAGTGRQRRKGLVLPHPEMQSRPFVLVPLADIAPRWRHPVTGQTVVQLRRRAARRGGGRILSTVAEHAAKPEAAVPAPHQPLLNGRP